jgi:signal transduction histidine kinase
LGVPEAIFAASEAARWLRPWMAVVVAVLAAVTVFTAFAEDMPEFHHVAVPAATAVVLAAWAVELSGLRWPRLALILGVVLPNLWLTLIGHVSANNLFLILLLGWVGVVGTRRESVTALAFALATVGVGIGLDALDGQIAWASWTSWLVGLLLVWLMTLVLAVQERLVVELRELRSRAEERTREIEALYSADETLHASLKVDEVLQALVDVATDLLGADKSAVMVWDEAHQRLQARAGRGFRQTTLARMVHGPGEGVTWRVAETGAPIVVDDVRQDPRVARHLSDPEGVRSFLQVPIKVGGEVFGVFGVNFCQPHTFSRDEQRVLLALAQRAALAIENARLYEQAQGKAALEERERLARELHDSVTQSLYGASLYAEAAGRALADGEVEPAVGNLHDLRETLQEALGEMRLLLFELRPPLLEEHGLAGALRSRLNAVEARAGLVTDFEGEASPRLPVEIEQELFRIAQEALNNVLKHGHATRASVRLDVSDEHIALEIADNGLGFEPSLGGGGGFGLASMRQRAERLGGSLRIDSAPGAGTRLCVEVPRAPQPHTALA